jgi:curli biogenesis system outer membrane secretion channel CsgG
MDLLRRSRIVNLAPFYRALAPAIACLSVATAGSAQTRPRIAVLGFENATASQIFGDQLGEAASDELTTQLVKSGAFSVIERRQIEDILAEQSMGMSGAVDAATAARIGKVLGVQYVLMGSISQFSIEQKSGGIGRLNLSASFAEAESKLDVRVVNTTTAEIVTVAEGGGKKRFGGATYKDLRLDRDFDAGIAQEALRPAVENAVEQIVSQKDALAANAPELAAGQVVGVREGSIYIDRGENAQVAVGQRFDVVRVVDTIRDANGNVLDEVTEKVGVIEVTRVLSQSAIGKVLEGEAKEGDRLRPNG